MTNNLTSQNQQITMNQAHNPFDQSFQSEQFDGESPDNRFPVCLDPLHTDGANTPISRFSDLTNHPSIKQDEKVQQNLQTNSEVSQDLLGYIQVLEKRNGEMAIALQKQKIKNSQIEQALILIRREDSNLLKKLQEQNERVSFLQDQLEKEESKVGLITSKYEHSKAEVGYLKELILLANNNYEELEKKYNDVLEKNRKSEEEQAHREMEMNNNVLEMKNILTNIINIPGGIEHPNCQNRKSEYTSLKSPKQDPDEVYRKMFLRTLKVKK